MPKINRILSISLWIIAAHSFAVGIGLIAHLPWMMSRSGFTSVEEPFFLTQGGVFHIVMAVGYAMAATDLKSFHCLAFFAVIVKCMATVFLFIYYFGVKENGTIIISALVDGLFATTLFIEYRAFKRTFAKA